MQSNSAKNVKPWWKKRSARLNFQLDTIAGIIITSEIQFRRDRTYHNKRANLLRMHDLGRKQAHMESFWNFYP